MLVKGSQKRSRKECDTYVVATSIEHIRMLCQKCWCKSSNIHTYVYAHWFTLTYVHLLCTCPIAER